MSQGTCAIDEARILRVLLHLEANLDERWTLQELADRAGLSPFHFHRVFRTVVGESVHRHIRRLRLERAALFIKNSDASTIELMLPSGFDSREGFSRAFAAHFGESPSDFRNRSIRRLKRLLRTLDGKTPLQVRLVQLPPCHVALTRVIGSPFHVLSKWVHIMRWARKCGLARDDTLIAQINHDDEIVTPWRRHRTDLCIALPGPCEVDPPFVCTKLADGYHAVADFSGSPRELHRTWIDMAERWLPTSGWYPSCHYFYDLARADLIPTSLSAVGPLLAGGIRSQLMVPVAPRPRLGWPIFRPASNGT